MNANDLNDLLGLDDAPAGGAEVITAAGNSDGGDPAVPVSPTALEVDAWGLRRGRELAESREWTEAAGSGFEDGLNEHEAADCFAAAFEFDPRPVESCSDPRRSDYFRSLMETPDYRQLHNLTALDDAASELAAARFAKGWHELHEKDDEARGRAEKSGKPESPRAADARVMRAVAAAVSEAKAEVEEMRESAHALGIGGGSDGGRTDPKALAAAYRRLRNSPRLKRIMELAGRFRRVAQSRQRMKTSHGQDEVTGIELGGDLARLVPSELALLADPDLEMLALRRLVERQSLCRELSAREPQGKGPICVCVDESGSMAGEKVATAKALALAMAYLGRRQNRFCVLIAYSGDSGERVLALPPGRWDEAALLDWLEQFIGRGSTLDIPLRELPRMWQQIGAPAGRTDILLITDAIVRLPAELAASFLAWKAEAKARVTSLIVDGQPGDLAAVSEEVYQVPAISAEAESTGAILSI
jgi:uncharacterized protein with von Willebrand factor type A (vWA) domain